MALLGLADDQQDLPPVGGDVAEGKDAVQQADDIIPGDAPQVRPLAEGDQHQVVVAAGLAGLRRLFVSLDKSLFLQTVEKGVQRPRPETKGVFAPPPEFFDHLIAVQVPVLQQF